MQFLYHPQSGKERIEIEGEAYNYLFKVRRHKKGEEVALRNLEDQNIYIYKIDEVSRREAILTLVHFYEKPVLPKRFFHLLWCVVDPKTIEKTLPTLNELGVGKISFIYCDRSQKNFRLKMDKLKKILINSCQQCGRSSLMELEVVKSLGEVLDEDVVVLDFSKKWLGCADNVQKALIGPEGGFSEDERKMFESLKVVGFDTQLVLRSESAAVAIASKVLV